MSTYRRTDSENWWYAFMWRGERVQESTRQKNRDVARTLEAKHRTRLAEEEKEREGRAEKLGCLPEALVPCAECGVLFNGANPITHDDNMFCCEDCERKWQSRRRPPTPTWSEFANGRFIEEMRSEHGGKPKTLTYYENGVRMLARFAPLQNLRLDQIGDEVIDEFVRWRRRTKARRKKTCVKVSTINRELECLRHALKVAERWDLIRKAPQISRLPGEVGRDRVLSHAEEQAYLAATKGELRDIATMMIDSAFRPEELFRARWENIRLKSVGQALYPHVHVPDGKTKFARRNVCMTPRVKALLEIRHEAQGRPRQGWVFPNDETASGHFDSLKSQHARALKESKVAAFPMYVLRHTCLTRMGEAGPDAFEIQRVAGHSSILISQRYVHPTLRKVEDAFTRLNAYNERKMEELTREQDGTVQ
ncbi:MAG TPA: site-specific integrase [Candidatus Sulfotelmatobacter sp.]|nr:site-specific integrase [Candidatus Sulfotelmatobacter sp.]